MTINWDNDVEVFYHGGGTPAKVIEKSHENENRLVYWKWPEDETARYAIVNGDGKLISSLSHGRAKEGDIIVRNVSPETWIGIIRINGVWSISAIGHMRSTTARDWQNLDSKNRRIVDTK